MAITLKDESLSFQAMPTDCPIHYLNFGILTNLIAPLVQQKRRYSREQRKEFLIKNILNVNLKKCFQELYRLSRMYPQYSLIDKLRSTQIKTKKSITKLVDTHEIPLIYLEDTYQTQLQGPPTFVVDNWVKCNNQYGVVCHVYGTSYVKIKLVKKIEDSDISTPMFHKWSRDYRNSIEIRVYSVWECEKIGHDTPEWKILRKKLIKEYNNNLSKRKELWIRMIPRLIQHSVMDNPLRSNEILRSYKLTWFQMRVNVLDKSMWENLKPIKKDNPSHLHCLWWYLTYPIGANIEHLRNTVLDLGILD